ncbi:hypothetical protein IWQ56_005620, partial [Coemansia nantahalensis]
AHHSTGAGAAHGALVLVRHVQGRVQVCQLLRRYQHELCHPPAGHGARAQRGAVRVLECAHGARGRGHGGIRATVWHISVKGPVLWAGQCTGHVCAPDPDRAGRPHQQGRRHLHRRPAYTRQDACRERLPGARGAGPAALAQAVRAAGQVRVSAGRGVITWPCAEPRRRDDRPAHER